MADCFIHQFSDLPSGEVRDRGDRAACWTDFILCEELKDQIKDETIGDDEAMVSFDVKSLFTNVPLDKPKR